MGARAHAKPARDCSARRVASTEYIYRIWTVTGSGLYQYASVIDRPPPIEVGIIDGALVIISGIADPTAPTIADIIQADDATWQRLLDTPQTAETADSEMIGTDIVAVIELPVATSSEPNGYLSVTLSGQEGVTFLEIDTTNAVIDDEGQYWKIEINERLRSRSTARAGGVLGTRLSDTAVTEPFLRPPTVRHRHDWERSHARERAGERTARVQRSGRCCQGSARST